MVVEMTSLQGSWAAIMPCIPVSEAVAQAIFEHYLPRYAGDASPERPGCWWVWPTGWIPWLACLLPAWRPAAPRIPLPSAALPWAWCRP